MTSWPKRCGEIDKNIIIYTDKEIGIEDGRQIVPVTSSPDSPIQRTDIRIGDFLASLGGLRQEWLLTEDKWAAEAFPDDSREEEDAEAEDGSES